jgi:hypothetical protein
MDSGHASYRSSQNPIPAVSGVVSLTTVLYNLVDGTMPPEMIRPTERLVSMVSHQRDLRLPTYQLDGDLSLVRQVFAPENDSKRTLSNLLPHSIFVSIRLHHAPRQSSLFQSLGIGVPQLTQFLEPLLAFLYKLLHREMRSVVPALGIIWNGGKVGRRCLGLDHRSFHICKTHFMRGLVG